MGHMDRDEMVRKITDSSDEYDRKTLEVKDYSCLVEIYERICKTPGPLDSGDWTRILGRSIGFFGKI